MSLILIKSQDSDDSSSWRQQEIALSSEAAHETAQALFEAIASGDIAFATCAKKRSDHHTAHGGGVCGKIWHGMLHDDIESAAFNLRVGEMSQPIESPQGWHLLLRTK